MITAVRFFDEASEACAVPSGTEARCSFWGAALVRPAIVCACVALSLAASPAPAAVMEVSRGGVVSIREDVGFETWEALDQGTLASGQIEAEMAVPARGITIVQDVPVPRRFAGLIQLAAASANVSPALLAALVSQESGWNAQAVSSKGAIGLAQLMPATARDLGVDPRDPAANLTGGARYLRQQLDFFRGDVEKALAAYNAGSGRVRKANGVPAIAETQAYVRSIMQRISSFRPEVK